MDFIEQKSTKCHNPEKKKLVPLSETQDKVKMSNVEKPHNKEDREKIMLIYLSATFPISPPRASTSCTSCDLAGPPAGLQGCVKVLC